jgi:hypothetical protein
MKRGISKPGAQNMSLENKLDSTGVKSWLPNLLVKDFTTVVQATSLNQQRAIVSACGVC